MSNQNDWSAAPDHIADARKMVRGEPASGVPSRDELIQCLLATRGQSEGTTADAILSMLTAAPQPAEQQPLKSSLALDAATHLTNWMELDWCECEGGHTCGLNEVRRTRDALLVAAEQQPAPHPDDDAVDRFAAANAAIAKATGEYHDNQ